METTTVAPSVDELNEKITNLQQRLDTALAAARKHRDLHEADIRFIGERLISEATEREWCKEFDDFVDHVNRSLTVSLPRRMNTYTVTQYYSVSRTIEVEALNEDEAIEKCSTADDWDDMERGDWEIHDVDLTDTEVEST